jgi:hypothetical protein
MPHIYNNYMIILYNMSILCYASGQNLIIEGDQHGI